MRALTVRRIGLAGFAIAVALLALAAWASYRSEADLREATRRVPVGIAGRPLAVLLLVGAAALLIVATRQRERAARDSAEAAARSSQESEARLGVILASIGDGVIATGERGRL